MISFIAQEVWPALSAWPEMSARISADAHAAGRLRLAVEQHDVHAAGVEQPEQRGRGRDLDDLRFGHVRGRATADRELHLCPRVGVVTVHNDLHGSASY